MGPLSLGTYCSFIRPFFKGSFGVNKGQYHVGMGPLSLGTYGSFIKLFFKAFLQGLFWGEPSAKWGGFD